MKPTISLGASPTWRRGTGQEPTRYTANPLATKCCCACVSAYFFECAPCGNYRAGFASSSFATTPLRLKLHDTPTANVVAIYNLMLNCGGRYLVLSALNQADGTGGNILYCMSAHDWCYHMRLTIGGGLFTAQS